jgi:hypothetical protein
VKLQMLLVQTNQKSKTTADTDTYSEYIIAYVFVKNTVHPCIGVSVVVIKKTYDSYPEGHNQVFGVPTAKQKSHREERRRVDSKNY